MSHGSAPAIARRHAVRRGNRATRKLHDEIFAVWLCALSNDHPVTFADMARRYRKGPEELEHILRQGVDRLIREREIYKTFCHPAARVTAQQEIRNMAQEEEL